MSAGIAAVWLASVILVGAVSSTVAHHVASVAMLRRCRRLHQQGSLGYFLDALEREGF